MEVAYLNKKVLFNKAISLLLSIMMCFSMVSVYAEDELASKTVEAAFGTPTVDGSIDEIWSSTNYTFIDRKTPTGEYDYTGWMKVLWDNEKLYVLAKIHTITLSADANTSAWNQDCLEIFVDENCGRTSTYEDNDYQLRTNFKGEKTSKNYSVDDMEVVTTTFDMGFVAEMAFPIKSVKLQDGLKMGFDAQVYRTSNFAFNAGRIGWSAYRADISTDTSDYGTVVLKNTVNVSNTTPPDFSLPVYENYEVLRLPHNDELTLIPDVSAMFNYKNETKVSVLHVDEQPCMEISTLAKMIGATVENGNILVKGGKRLTYTAGERLMQDNVGNIIMLVEATNYDGKLYIPLSSLETTLTYNINYNRFKKELDIVPFNEPKDAEFVAYVKDYGAVGDGVTDDKEALLAAFRAAIKSGVPARVELESEKTYYISEVQDTMRIFWINGVKDFVFDGNGSTLLLSPAQFGAFEVQMSERVRIEDLKIDSNVPPSTQGWIRGTNEADRSVILEFEEGYPVLVPQGWNTAHSQTESYNYISPIQPGTGHSKHIHIDYARFEDLKPLGNGLYKATLIKTAAGIIPYLEEGDRFVANYTYHNYDHNERSRGNSGNGHIHLSTCGDVELKNVTISAGKFAGCSINNVWGNVRLNNFNGTNDDGRIWSNGRDFVHALNMRGTLLWENSTVVGNGDDIINTKTTHIKFLKSLGNRKYTMQANACFEQGDELLIFNPDEKIVIGRAFVQEVEYIDSTLNGETAEIVLDRDIEGIKLSSTVAINLSSSNSGTVLRNNVFKNGKRWAWVNRSPNCIFEGNYSENMLGSMVAAENELYYGEAPFPSAFTIRNNKYYCDGNANPRYDPIQVSNNEAEFGDTAAIDGILLEGNVIETSRVGTVISISDVEDLYMINNKIINHAKNGAENLPITIRNSVICQIDGVTLEYDHNGVAYGVNIAGCEYDESDIKNIDVCEKDMGTYKDWWK